MFGIIQAIESLFSNTRRTQAARPARLGLETLETREVPAVVSAGIKTDSWGQKYLDIKSNNADSRVTLTQAYINTNQWSDTLVVKDDANGFRYTVNVRTAKLNYVSFTGGIGRDSVRSSMPYLGLIADGKGGNDILVGGRGHDILRGGVGNDWLEAGGGNNKLYGGTGDDQLRAGGFYSYLEGGDGRDAFFTGATTAQYRKGNLDTPLRNLLTSFRE